MVAKAKINQVIIIIIDDVRAEHIFKWLNQGKLQNIAKIANNGITSWNCITSFPSITYPCFPNIINGAYSGYYPKEGSGIPAFHWIARTDPPSEGRTLHLIRDYSLGFQAWKSNEDLGPNVQTIFEQVGDGNFFSSFSIIYRGSLFFPQTKLKTAWLYIKYEYIKKNLSLGNFLSLKMVEQAYKKPNKFFSTNEVPKVAVGYIPGTDNLMHHKGFDHPDYINEILRCDEYIGSLIKTIKDLGYYDDTAICIVSDHGNYKSQKMYKLDTYFQQKGLIPYVSKKGAGDFDATFGSIGFFNFRGDNWHHHPTIEQLRNFKPKGATNKQLDLFETLWDIPGVKLMYHRDDSNTPHSGIIHLERRNRKTGKSIKGQIIYDGHGKKQKTKYIFDDEDLFGYNTHEKTQTLLDDKSHTIDEWLTATYQFDFPLLIDQLPRYFKNPRSCDIMVSTCGEYGFGYEHGKTKSQYSYSHDVALKNSMTVPLIIGGSEEIPNFELPYCKTTDIVPTLLDLLGISPHWSVVGKSLLGKEKLKERVV